MKKPLLLLLLIPALAAVAVPARILLHSEVFKVDTKASKIEWTGEKITGKHTGTVAISSGEVVNNHGKIGGKFVMDMTSMAVTDLTGEKKGKLEGHLKSDDFFGVQKFPTSTFDIISVTPKSGVTAGSPNFDVKGNLTIKGITKEINFPAMIKFEGGKMTTEGELKVDRSKFDVRYGSKSFFEDIGDKAIYDEFILKLNVVANI